MLSNALSAVCILSHRCRKSFLEQGGCINTFWKDTNSFNPHSHQGTIPVTGKEAEANGSGIAGGVVQQENCRFWIWSQACQLVHPGTTHSRHQAAVRAPPNPLSTRAHGSCPSTCTCLGAMADGSKLGIFTFNFIYFYLPPLSFSLSLSSFWDYMGSYLIGAELSPGAAIRCIDLDAIEAHISWLKKKKKSICRSPAEVLETTQLPFFCQWAEARIKSHLHLTRKGFINAV